jgi:hypothetical protein
VRQRAISVGFCPTGDLLQEDAVSEHRVGDATCDADNGSRVDDVNSVVFPSAAHLLYPFDASKTDAIGGRLNIVLSPDAAFAFTSVDPDWRV